MVAFMDCRIVESNAKNGANKISLVNCSVRGLRNIDGKRLKRRLPSATFGDLVHVVNLVAAMNYPRLFVLLACTSTAAYFAGLCLLKYLRREIGTRINEVQARHVPFPAVTVCSRTGYKADVSRRYGVEDPNHAFDHGLVVIAGDRNDTLAEANDGSG